MENESVTMSKGTVLLYIEVRLLHRYLLGVSEESH
jgi:hypothetical protein